MKPTSSPAVGLVLAMLSVPARAAEPTPQVDDVDLVKLLNIEVSTATKTAESLDEAPAVIRVVTRDDIRRWGYQSVAEVLSHTVGFYLTDDHVLPNVSVRGMTGGLGSEGGVIKVMIDGRSVAYRTTSGNWLGIELVPLESVAQIEIIRGPASALYGADAFLGVVNIITIAPEDLRPVNARVALGVTGANAGGRFDVASGFRSGQFDLLLGAAGESADRSGLTLPSESPAPTLPSWLGARRTALGLERRSLVLQSRLAYRDDAAGHLILSGYASGIDREGDFAHWAQLTNGTDASGNPTGTRIALGQFRVNLDGLWHATKTLDLAVQGTYFDGGVLPADRIEVASDVFYVERHARYRGVDTLAEARWFPSQRFNVITGLEVVYDRERFGAPARIERATGESAPSTGTSRAYDLANLGVYLSSNLKLFDPWLKLTGGVRYDDHSVYGGQVTGRFGLTSHLLRPLVAKLLYGSAFKAPSPYLLYAQPLRPGDVVGNPDLEPQRVDTLEYQLSFKPTRFFGVNSGVSYSVLADKAEFTPQGINQTARNVASQRSLSWETRADIRHYDDYNAYAAFELVHSIRDLGQEGYAAMLVGDRNVVYPSWIARAGVVFSVPSPASVPLELGSRALLAGPRRAADASIVERGGDFSLPAYLVLDVSLQTRELYWIPGHETRLALRGRNLLLARGPDAGFSGFEYPLPPGELFVELSHAY